MKNIMKIRVFPVLLSMLALPLFSQVELEVFSDGFIRPVAISNAGDSRLFIVEQQGRIKIADSSGSVLSKPFLDIGSRVKSTGNEQGLLGLAFHPDYQSKGYFYVNYTDLSGNTVISRFMRSGTDPDVAEADSEFQILSFSQPYSNHNGGDLKFGPDGYLYIGTGDGGSRGDPENRAQNPGLLLGKMLRIDVDAGSPYAIPESNPFTDSVTVLDEIWAMGLRNPWRFSFDRETGDLWIGDVGQGEREEIDFQSGTSTGGENYGWRCFEGSLPYNSLNCPDGSSFVPPVYEYAHDAGGGCSVTGGFVYRGSDFPVLRGRYFFADYCTNNIWSLHDSAGSRVLSDHGRYPDEGFSTFGEDHSGELYIAGLNSGIVYRIKDPGMVSGMESVTDAWMRVYPNPVHDYVWIETSMNESDNTRIAIYSLSGELLLSSQYTGNRVQINLDFLAAGLYFLEVGTKTRKQYRKILIN